jgi:type I restriction enzyme, S subunit
VSEYPPSWIEVALGNLLSFNYGKSLPDRARSGAGFPVYGSNGIVGYHDSALTNGETLIIGRKGSVGEVHFSSGSCFPIDTTYYVDQFYGMPTRYWFYQLKNLRLSQLNKATAIPGLNREDAYRAEALLAPLNEQKRIADKLDVLLARVDACRDRLDRVRGILDRFRQTVLLVAMSGELTEDWRQVSRESAEWQNVLLSEICVSITDGTHQPPPQTQHGIPFITIAAINAGRLQIDKATRFVSSSYFEQLQASRKPELGDILFSVTGSIAIPALVDVSEPFMFQRHIAILKPNSSQIISKFLLYSLSTENIKRQAQAVATGTAQKTIPLSGLRGFVIDLPSIDEQQEIIRRVESLFDYADRLKSRYQKAYNQVEQLTPALLAKAFSGELVPQNSDDEPASALLDRIRTERATQLINPKRVLTDRKPKMTKMSEESVKEVIRQLPKNTFSFDDLRQKLPGDYESLRDILFSLLDEPEPSIMQIFDQEAQAMCFAKE